MTNTNRTMSWKFQTADGLSVHDGYPTDARGLRLREECGYAHVDMGNGWLQLSVAIRKVALAERISALVVA